MASAKQSALDTLHRLYVATLTLQLQAGEPSALRIPTKPATHSNRKPATDSDLKPAGIPI
jgi:hypothetical protein